MLGDSITLGIGASEGAGFVELLGKGINKYEFINLGCSFGLLQAWVGTSSNPECYYASAWNNLAVQATPIDAWHILLGGAQAPWSWQPETWEVNLAGLVGRTTGCVLISMRPKDPAHLDPGDPVVIKHAAYRVAIQNVIDADPRVQLGVNFYPLLDPVTDFDNGDVHPNALGYLKMAVAFSDRLQELEAESLTWAEECDS